MRDQLIAYVNHLFERAEPSARLLELRDELLQNTLDHYDDEIADGKDEQTAYAAAVQGIGDVEPLVGPLRRPTPLGHFRRAVAISLYVLCVIPVILCGQFGEFWEALGVCMMFWMAAVATTLLLLGDLHKDRRRNLRAIGIGIFVLCVTPTIFFDGLLSGALGDVLGICLMFALAAVATVLVVFSCSAPAAHTSARAEAAVPDNAPAAVSNTVPAAAPAANAAQPEKKKAFYKQSLAYRIGVPIYWVFVVCLFGFAAQYGAWYYAWLIFPAAGAVYDIVLGLILSVKGFGGGRKLAGGLLWLAMLVGFLALTVTIDGSWMYTWLVFPIAALLNGVIGGIFDLIKGENNYEK